VEQSFSKRLRAAQDRLAALLEMMGQLPPDQRDMVGAAVEELSSSLEELRQQNEELQAARKELEAECRRYEELFALAPDGYVVTDAQGVIEEANTAASELLGVRAAFLVGKPLAVYVDSEDLETLDRMMDRAQRRGRGTRLEGELHLCPREGNPFAAAVSVTAVRGGDGRGASIRCMVRDVSESGRLVTENRRQRMFLERLMGAAPLGIAVVRGEEHRFEMANPAYRAIPGARRPIVGQRFKDVFPYVPD
jgi:PAS domain S-box-containing protein